MGSIFEVLKYFQKGYCGMDFMKNAIREGNRDRILHYWEFVLVVFNSTKHHNYAKEAVDCYCSTTTIYYRRGRRIKFYGLVVST